MGSRVEEDDGDGDAVGAAVGERVAETEDVKRRKKRKRGHGNGKDCLSFIVVLRIGGLEGERFEVGLRTETERV